ncbi:hypothetical protein F4859DRAFT_514138 [Xylaria cf. heliscus]|nr:hypothetical protein F4859DRAFT_514138 [Xylaria cf. heliscus]
MSLFRKIRGARIQGNDPSQHDHKAFPSGIKPLYCPPTGSTVDIVFIHGLTGDRERTWTAKNASEPWPKTLLASKLPTARILTFGYDAYVAHWRGVVSQSRIADHSGNLLASLADHRETDDDTVNEDPIIFVCHSLGGLALAMARQRPDEHIRRIVRSVRGVIFLGTPHHGSGLAHWAEQLAKYIGVVKQTNQEILKVLKADSEVLARIQDSFHTMVQARNQEGLKAINISCFYEQLPLQGVGLVVPQNSAIIPGYIPIGIHGNHMDMCRFKTVDDPGFVSVHGVLRRWIKEINTTGLPQEITSASGTIGASQNTPVGRDGEESSISQFIVPYPDNPQFVGRSEILKQLKSRLDGQKPHTNNQLHRRIALYGLGGIGKTQVTLAYVFWLHNTSPDVSIFWVHASSINRFRQAYAEIAEECQVPGYDDPKVDVLSLLKKWLEQKNRGRWLMVIDNADDAQFFCRSAEFSGAEDEKYLGRYIPECAHGDVLITTRNKQVGLQLTKGVGKSLLEIGKMDDVECCQLLHASLDNNLIATEELSTLASRLEHLPLALAQAAAFIQENTITVTRYLQLLDRGNQSFVGLLSEEFATMGRDSDTPHAVAGTWILSFERIEQQDPLASDLLLLMSLFDRQAIPMEFLSDFFETHHSNLQTEDNCLDKALGLLKAHSLIAEEKGDSFNMHRLVQLVTQKWLTTKEKMRQFSEKAILTVSHCYPYGKFETREKCTAYLPHVQAVLNLHGTRSRDENLARGVILSCAASLFDIQGQFDLAEKFQTQTVDIRREVLGPNDPDTLTNMSNLAAIYRNQRRWDEAESLEVQVLKIRKTILGPDHPDTLTSMNNLATIYQDQKRWDEAESLIMQVLKISKTIPGLNYPNILTSMSNLAATYLEQKRWDEAESLGVQVLKIRKTILGPDHPDTLTSMSNLATIYQDQERWDEAESLGVQVLKIRKTILGLDHPKTLISMSNLAAIYQDQKRWDEAESLGVQILKIRKTILGPDHPKTLISMSNLAAMYQDQERWDKAESLGVQVLKIRKTILGPDHPKTLTSMNILACTWKTQGRTDNAIQLMENCVEAQLQVLGQDHPNTADSLRSLNKWREEQAAGDL